jgi:iron complex transport system substrate-binding protein
MTRISSILLNILALAALIAGTFLLIPSREDAEEAAPPRTGRIVSLSPSITRQVIDLESGHLICGITSFDDPPENGRAIVGSMISPDIEKIVSLRPDVVLLSMEDNPTQPADRLFAIGVPCVVFQRNKDFSSIRENYLRLARLLGKVALARRKLHEYERKPPGRAPSGRPLKVALFVSHNPLLAATASSFIGGVIEQAGGVNIFERGLPAYAMASVEYIVMRDPDVIVSIIPGSDGFFAGLFDRPRHVSALRTGNVFTMDPGHICYYSPADYVASVKELSIILAKAESNGP